MWTHQRSDCHELQPRRTIQMSHWSTVLKYLPSEKDIWKWTRGNQCWFVAAYSPGQHDAFSTEKTRAHLICVLARKISGCFMVLKDWYRRTQWHLECFTSLESTSARWTFAPCAWQAVSASCHGIWRDVSTSTRKQPATVCVKSWGQKRVKGGASVVISVVDFSFWSLIHISCPSGTSVFNFMLPIRSSRMRSSQNTGFSCQFLFVTAAEHFFPWNNDRGSMLGRWCQEA